MVILENTKTVYDLVQNAGKEYKDKVFLRYEENDVIYEKSYAEFAKDCNAVSAWIEEKSQAYGHKVHAAILGRSSYFYLTALLGTVSAGSKEGLVDNIERSDADIIFYDWEFNSQIEVIKEKCKNVKHYICLQNRQHIECAETILKQYENNNFISDAKPEDCAVIIFTSGTTGRGKGVMLSNGNLIDNTFCNTTADFFH